MNRSARALLFAATLGLAVQSTRAHGGEPPSPDSGPPPPVFGPPVLPNRSMQPSGPDSHGPMMPSDLPPTNAVVPRPFALAIAVFEIVAMVGAILWALLAPTRDRS